MVDKNFVEIKITEEEFREVSVLLCVFHVIKAVKTRIARSDLLFQYKQDILMAFRQAVYAFSRDVFETRWRDLIQICPDHLQEYFEQNWRPIPLKWALYGRRTLPTLSNTTNNRMESFNLLYKQVLRDRHRTVPHLTECIRILLDVLDSSQS